jgi:hypothetical protein
VIDNRDIDRMAGVSREVAEAQRDAQAAFADNVMASQRRGMDVARDGLRLMELQRDNMLAARDWWFSGLKLLQLQQRNAEFARGWASGAVNAIKEQAEQNVRTFETFAGSVRAQQESVRDLSNVWFGAYQDALSTFAGYAQEGVKVAQKNTEQGAQVARQATEQGMQLANEAADTTARAVKNGTRSTLVLALENGEYDEMNVGEISKNLEELSEDELKKVRAYEKRHKNRETLIEQIDRKIKASSS